MVLAVLVVFLMGGVTGVAIETNTPAVSNFGDKYLAADVEYGTDAHKAPVAKK